MENNSNISSFDQPCHSGTEKLGLDMVISEGEKIFKNFKKMY